MALNGLSMQHWETLFLFIMWPFLPKKQYLQDRVPQSESEVASNSSSASFTVLKPGDQNSRSLSSNYVKSSSNSVSKQSSLNKAASQSSSSSSTNLTSRSTKSSIDSARKSPNQSLPPASSTSSSAFSHSPSFAQRAVGLSIRRKHLCKENKTYALMLIHVNIHVESA